jgi:hypothetical protein
MIHKFTDKPVFRVPEGCCPICGDKFNAGEALAYEGHYVNPSGVPPFPGAWALCNSCGELLVYGEDLLLELPSDAKLRSMTAEQYEFMEQKQEQIRRRN